jgi:ComF family protein
MGFFDFLFPPRVDEVALRAISADEFLGLLSPQLVEYTTPETTSLLPFHDARVRAAIHEAKYRGSERAFSLLGAALAEYVRDSDELGRKIHFVPVPLGKTRLKERGFNQVEEVVKRVLAQFGPESGIQVETGLLIRTRETISQVSLPREARKENMRGAFALSPSKGSVFDPACTYIVLDDVITTGATLQAAIDVLRQAGATHIIPLALAH